MKHIVDHNMLKTQTSNPDSWDTQQKQLTQWLSRQSSSKRPRLKFSQDIDQPVAALEMVASQNCSMLQNKSNFQVGISPPWNTRVPTIICFIPNKYNEILQNVYNYAYLTFHCVKIVEQNSLSDQQSG